jgi:hypothetical protein
MAAYTSPESQLQTARSSDLESSGASKSYHEKIATSVTPDGSDHGSNEEELEKDAQAGVRAVEAATSVWTKAHLWTAYGMCVQDVL